MQATATVVLEDIDPIEVDRLEGEGAFKFGFRAGPALMSVVVLTAQQLAELVSRALVARAEVADGR